MTMTCEISRDDPAESVADDMRSLGADETEVLEMMASGRAVSEILDALCRLAGHATGGARCGIYLIDWAGARIRSFAAPDLPSSFNTALCNTPVHPDSGPCGRAACLKMPVLAADLDSDPVWQRSAFRRLATNHGVRSCWSTPIYAATNEVVGTLAVLRDQPFHPTPEQEGIVGRITRLATIALQRSRADAALDKAEAELRRITHVIALGSSFATDVIHPISGVVINASTGLRMLSGAPPDIAGACQTLRRTLRDCGRASEIVTQLRALLRLSDHSDYYLGDHPGGT